MNEDEDICSHCGNEKINNFCRHCDSLKDSSNQSCLCLSKYETKFRQYWKPTIFIAIMFVFSIFAALKNNTFLPVLMSIPVGLIIIYMNLSLHIVHIIGNSLYVENLSYKTKIDVNRIDRITIESFLGIYGKANIFLTEGIHEGPNELKIIEFWPDRTCFRKGTGNPIIESLWAKTKIF